jgi:hypothetical protein
MKIYKTSSSGIEINEYELIKRTPKTVTYIEEYNEPYTVYSDTKSIKTRTVTANIDSTWNKFHETKENAIRYLIKKINSEIKSLVNRIDNLTDQRYTLLKMLSDETK